MAGEVNARVVAVRDIAHGIESYQQRSSQAIASARSELNQLAAEFQTAVARSQQALHQAQRELEAAQAALAACQENCGGLQQAVARCAAAEGAARQRHERNLRAQ